MGEVEGSQAALEVQLLWSPLQYLLHPTRDDELTEGLPDWLTICFSMQYVAQMTGLR